MIMSKYCQSTKVEVCVSNYCAPFGSAVRKSETLVPICGSLLLPFCKIIIRLEKLKLCQRKSVTERGTGEVGRKVEAASCLCVLCFPIRAPRNLYPLL